MMATGQARFEALDSWRGLAALGVALFHLQFAGLIAGSELARHAFLFVDFFFVLSGFVIMHGYGAVLDRPEAARSFLVRRFARLYPLHLVTLGVLLAVQIVLVGVLASGIGGPGVAAPFSGLFTPASLTWQVGLASVFGFDSQLTWNVPSWSVSAEIWAYLLFAALAVLTVNRAALRTAAFALVALVGAVLVFAHPAGHIDVTHDLGFARCVYGFFLGALCRMQFDTLPRPRPGATVIGTVTEVAVVALVIGFIIVAGRTAISFLAPFVFVLAVLVFGREQGALSAALRARPFQALGTWSYSIYLWQFPLSYGLSLVLGLLAVLTGREVRMEDPAQPGHMLVDLGAPWLNDLATLGFLASLVLVAWISFRLIEEPARRWITGQFDAALPPRPA